MENNTTEVKRDFDVKYTSKTLGEELSLADHLLIKLDKYSKYYN